MKCEETEWPQAAAAADLKMGDLHVWRVDLAECLGNIDRLFETLSHDEIARSKQFRFEADARRFIARRGALRMILASTAGVKADEITFSYNRYGRPELTREIARDFVFSLSVSRDAAVIAVTRSRRIGIDIEYLDETFPCIEIAERYFSAEEVMSIEKLTPRHQTAAFFFLWTQKEAYVKAVGEGLGHPLPERVFRAAQYDLTFSAAKAAAGDDWLFTTCLPFPGTIASLAIDGSVQTICHRTFSLV